ncbi:MAG: putative cupin superfamily sugar epimerase [Salibacteraceae bacterium]
MFSLNRMKESITTRKIERLKSHFKLLAHPEGGYYKETYRSIGNVKNPYAGASERSFSTGIYFLLVSGNFSAFHRIKQDEMWHFYDGDPINLHVITTKGNYELVKIGRYFSEGEVPQYVVKAGDWFASEVSVSEGFSFAGCTVSPGFDFVDFEMADREDLLTQYPEFNEVIMRLTRC